MLLLLPKHTKNPCVGPGPTLAFVFEMGEPLEDFEETEKGDVTKAMRNKGRSRWWPDRSRWSTVRAELMGVGGATRRTETEDQGSEYVPNLPCTPVGQMERY